MRRQHRLMVTGTLRNFMNLVVRCLVSRWLQTRIIFPKGAFSCILIFPFGSFKYKQVR